MGGVDPVVLRTRRLVLDQPTAADVDRIAEYCQDPPFERYMATPWPYRRADALHFVQRVAPANQASGVEETWAIRLDGDLIGMISARVDQSDVGYWLGRPHRGHGYLGEALDAVLEHRFALGQSLVNWECVTGNLASARVAWRRGFTFTGTAPSAVTFRDGSHPPAWHGVLKRRDDRAPKQGWPPALFAAPAASSSARADERST
jgi:RimJ/RimL family protein N-acetyltransferase